MRKINKSGVQFLFLNPEKASHLFFSRQTSIQVSVVLSDLWPGVVKNNVSNRPAEARETTESVTRLEMEKRLEIYCRFFLVCVLLFAKPPAHRK